MDPKGFGDADKSKRTTDDMRPSVSEQLAATVELLKEKRMLIGKVARVLGPHGPGGALTSG